MKSFVQHGEKMSFSNTSGVQINSGAVVVVGERVGVAEVDIPNNDKGTVLLTGVFELPKAAGALTQGQKLFFDTVAKNFTGTASANALRVAGEAHEAAAGGDATVLVRLLATPKQAAAQVDSVAATVAAVVVDFNALLAKLRAAGIIAQ